MCVCVSFIWDNPSFGSPRLIDETTLKREAQSCIIGDTGYRGGQRVGATAIIIAIQVEKAQNAEVRDLSFV